MIKLVQYWFLLFCIANCFVGMALSPPQIDVEGEQLYCGEAPMPIITDISISGGEGTLDEIFVQIATGCNLADGRTFKGHFALKR